MPAKATAIIVTHNSENYLDYCIEALKLQSHPVSEIIIVDSGSTDTTYLHPYGLQENIKLICVDNIGFSAANNRGVQEKSEKTEYILFLNPDTFLERDALEKAIAILEKNMNIGMVSGRLTGFDIETKQSTNYLDSTGIFRNFYGRWYDRGRNMIDSGQFPHEEEVPALCGALLLCREEVWNSLAKTVFDEDFFLYKEDIELSLRLRKKGWKLLYSPKIRAYHCRGWKKREMIPRKLKIIAAQNEILLYKKHPSPYIVWAYLKYWLVVFFRL